MHKKKNILILGGSSDIGLSLINLIDTNKYNIGAHCYTGDSRLIKHVKKVRILKKNLNNKKNCNELVEVFINKIGTPNIIVNLIGEVGKRVDWKKLTEKNFDNIFKINLASALFISQKIFNLMKKNKYGKFIFVSTGSVNKGASPKNLLYVLAKAGIENFSKTLAKEGGEFNITSNCVSPGFINTRLHSTKLKKNKKDFLKRSGQNVLKRPGTTEEVANLINYLILDKSNFITGENIAITGGDWI